MTCWIELSYIELSFHQIFDVNKTFQMQYLSGSEGDKFPLKPRKLLWNRVDPDILYLHLILNKTGNWGRNARWEERKSGRNARGEGKPKKGKGIKE